MRVLLFLLLCLIPATASAAGRCWPLNADFATLNSVTFWPGAGGVDVTGYDKYLTIDYEKVAGTQETTVEVNAGNGWKALTPTMTDDFYAAVNPDHVFIKRVRLNMGTCTACTATARLCSRPNDE